MYPIVSRISNHRFRRSPRGDSKKLSIRRRRLERKNVRVHYVQAAIICGDKTTGSIGLSQNIIFQSLISKHVQKTNFKLFETWRRYTMKNMYDDQRSVFETIVTQNKKRAMPNKYVSFLIRKHMTNRKYIECGKTLKNIYFKTIFSFLKTTKIKRTPLIC